MESAENGYRCQACKVEWNWIWCSTVHGFPNGACPKCGGIKIEKLKQVVPFTRPRQPDFECRCTCGGVFQRPFPKNFDVFESDPGKLRTYNIFSCPYCKRSNEATEGGWYEPPTK